MNQAKTQTISNEETLLKDCRLKELGDSLECTQQELQTCQTERDELKQNLQEIEKAKEELSRRTAASGLTLILQTFFFNPNPPFIETKFFNQNFRLKRLKICKKKINKLKKN